MSFSRELQETEVTPESSYCYCVYEESKTNNV